jgi:hypothetical protein
MLNLKANAKATKAGTEKCFVCQEFKLLHPALANHFRVLIARAFR